MLGLTCANNAVATVAARDGICCAVRLGCRVRLRMSDAPALQLLLLQEVSQRMLSLIMLVPGCGSCARVAGMHSVITAWMLCCCRCDLLQRGNFSTVHLETGHQPVGSQDGDALPAALP